MRPRGYVFLAVMAAAKPAPVEDVDLLSAEPAPALFELFFIHIQITTRVYFIFKMNIFCVTMFNISVLIHIISNFDIFVTPTWDILNIYVSKNS